MAVWASTLESDDLYKAVVCDVEFTHPNKLTQEATFVYVAAI